MADSQQVSVSIEKTATSVTVRDDGMSDVMYARLITDVDTGDVIVRDVVRETVETATVFSEIESLKAIEPSSDA
jgi:hypothetical protein